MLFWSIKRSPNGCMFVLVIQTIGRKPVTHLQTDRQTERQTNKLWYMYLVYACTQQDIKSRDCIYIPCLVSNCDSNLGKILHELAKSN